MEGNAPAQRRRGGEGMDRAAGYGDVGGPSHIGCRNAGPRVNQGCRYCPGTSCNALPPDHEGPPRFRGQPDLYAAPLLNGASLHMRSTAASTLPLMTS